MPPRGRVKVTTKDNGYAAMVAQLGELGTITLGVQGKEALEPHPNPHGKGLITVGEIAKIHELGLGVPRRSWLVVWLEANAQKMRRQTRDQLKRVLSGRDTRAVVLKKLGYKWTEQLRQNVDNDGVAGPPLSEYTVQRKGHGIKLLETATLRNSITYRVYLPRKSSVKNKAQRETFR